MHILSAMTMRALPAVLLLPSICRAQGTPAPPQLLPDSLLASQLAAIVRDTGLDSTFMTGEDGPEQISLAVIDLGTRPARLGGVHPGNFIYPASVYKMYVGATVLGEIAGGTHALREPYVVRAPNDVDREREIPDDPRPLLREGDTVTVNYLLDLMLTRSDNSAANCLIDIAGREKINALIDGYGWRGSEVTRKFLRRKFEPPPYDTIRGTSTCALHAAEFMYRIYTGTLVSPWVSRQMMTFLGRQLDTSKLAAGLPRDAMFYHKTGWYADWTNDVGIVEGRARYIIACLVPEAEERAGPKMRRLSERIYRLMLDRKAGAEGQSR